MKKNLKLFSVLLICSFLVLAFAAGCSTTDEGKKTVKLGYVNWAEGVAMTNLAQAILEDKMGYEVIKTMGDVGPIFTSVANGSYDAFLDAWLPITHESYLKEYGDDLADLGYNYEGARIGLVVPAYVGINSIEELNSFKDQLQDRIVGIDSGAGIMKATDKAIAEYGIDLELIAGSDITMTAAMKKAIDNEDYIVVTGWTPHWKFARWDLKFLEDPKGIYGSKENIHTVARKGLEEDMPDVAEFLRNFKMTDDTLGDLMGRITESDKDELETAREWMKDNEGLVNSWLPK